MKLYVHDLTPERFQELFPHVGAEDAILGAGGTCTHCIGCFGCWLKTPGTCVLRDGNQQIGKLFIQSEEVILISRCVYGGFSPFVKTVLDRSIGQMLPFFRMVNGEMHHTPRTENRPRFSAYFYGDVTPDEQRTAAELVTANAINLSASASKAEFYISDGQMKGAVS